LLEPEVFLRGDIVLPPNPSDPTNKPGVAEVVQAYFQLLRNDNAGFLTLRDELGANQYAVNFKKLKHTMKRTLFEGLLTDRFGVASCRIVRILMEKGKLDESRIQKLAMLPPKDVRYKLGMLLTAGIVEIQVV
jgi:DNA-directed RNA polymerase III subunit RPC3